jgi:hypothetical protein
VATYYFVPPFRNAKFCGVPSQAIVKFGSEVSKKVAEHCLSQLKIFTRKTDISALCVTSKERGPSFEGNSCSANQDLSHLAWNPKVNYQQPTTDPMINQIYLVHYLTF